MVTYNVIHAGGNNLNMVLRQMAHMHVDLGFLTETKLSHSKYTRNCEGYSVYSTRSDGFKGGVALFYCNSSQWTVEGIQAFGPNVLRCSLVSGNHRWICVGVYFPPSESDGTTLNFLEQATRNASHPLVVMGDFNCDLACSSAPRNEIPSLLSLLHLSDVADHFPHPRGQWTWSQWRSGRYIRSTTDYVLSQDPFAFSRWAIKIPRYHSDHRAIVTELRLTKRARTEHRRYWELHNVPFQPTRPLTRMDQTFESLCALCDLPGPSPHRSSSWISQGTWRLIDARAALVHQHRFHHHLDDEPVAQRTRSHDVSHDERYLQGICREDCCARLHILSRQIRHALRQDRKQRAARVALEAEAHLASHEVHEAYRSIQGWYRDRGPLQSKPLFEDLQRLSSEYESLYARRPLVGRPLLVEVDPYVISDEIPSEDEIRVALHRLRKRRAAGPSRMKVESLLGWETSNPEAWKLLIGIVQESFLGFEVPTAYSQAILVLIPKSEAGFRGVTLLEVLYKLWGMIVYRRASQVIQFHPDIHGFRSKRGCETAILEAKLEMQWAAFNATPYFQIFLDLAKAYDSIDRERLLELLAGYGFGPNVLRFLRRVWANACLALRQMGYHGLPISSERGIWQGDILSPLFLNIIVDCILRQWHRQIGRDTVGKFYADDGRIAGATREIVQEDFEVLLDLFAHIGLHPNVFKTKAMVSVGHRRPDFMSNVAFKRRFDPDSGPTYRARKLAKVQCPYCSHAVSNQYLPTHIRHVHGALPDVSTDCTRTSPPPCKRPRTSDPPAFLNHYTIRLGPGMIVCPVPDCPAHSTSSYVFRRHLCIRHPMDHFRLSDDSIEFTQCPHCGLFLDHLTPRHIHSQFCIRQSARRARILSRSQCPVTVDTSTPFHIGDRKIAYVSNFRYLGHVLCEDDSDDMAANTRLHLAKRVWGRFSHLLQADGASIETMGRFYRTIIQQTLLFGSATWVLTARSLNRLEHFQARCARGITHRHIRRRADGTWITPHTEEVLATCHLQPLAVCIQRRRHTLFKHYAETSPLYRQCLTLRGTSLCSLAWWNLNLD